MLNIFLVHFNAHILFEHGQAMRWGKMIDRYMRGMGGDEGMVDERYFESPGAVCQTLQFTKKQFWL